MTAIASPVTPAPAPVDLAAVKRRQQATWASGDFSVVAARITLAAELLCEAADLQAGQNVLDVATGSGNAAIAAARRGCIATGVDYVPALLERARLRTAVEHLAATYVTGDAEDLPFPDASFDATLSIYGAMFAPNHGRTAAELARVTRPGGKIALASWTPDGFIGQILRVVSKHVTPAPGLTPPVRWGDEAHLRAIFGGTIASITSTVRTFVFRFASAEENVSFFRTWYGPTLKTFESLAPDAQAALAKDLADLARAYDRNGGTGGPVAITADYLETVIVRR